MPPISPLTSSNSPTSALLLRLNLLEDLLSPSLSITSSSHPDHKIDEDDDDDGDGINGSPRPGQDVLSRTEALERRLNDVIRESGHEGLRRFVDRFDNIQTFLAQHPPPVSPSVDPTSSTSTSSSTTPSTSTSISIENKLPLLLSSHADLLRLPSQGEELKSLLGRGVDGSGGLGRYYDHTSSPSSSSKTSYSGSSLGASHSHSPTPTIESPGRASTEIQGSVGGRLEEVDRVLNVRQGGKGGGPMSTSDGPGSGSKTASESASAGVGGPSRGENLRRVGEVLGRWDGFIKDSSQIFLNLHQTMTELERAVERAERVRGIKA